MAASQSQLQLAVKADRGKAGAFCILARAHRVATSNETSALLLPLRSWCLERNLVVLPGRGRVSVRGVHVHGPHDRALLESGF